MTTTTVDNIPGLISLRTKASRFFAVLLWLHVPIVLSMAASNGVNWIGQAALVLVIVMVPTLYAIYRPASFGARVAFAVALTCMPILFVYDNPGQEQIEFHFYFFVVFAMLVAFCDWRAIFIAAALTSVHHIGFDLLAPARIFPTEGGLGRVALHGIFVVVECGVLVWIISQLRGLFLTAKRVEEIAAGHEAAALTDNLTQLGNHRGFHEDFEREVARAGRHGRMLTLALVDVDDFKSINDERGHMEGDRFLATLGDIFRQELRTEDRAYRIGGDEFAILLVETGADDARVALDRIRCRVERSILGPTVSIGYANLQATQLTQEPFEFADTALYEAKRRGRNMVVGFKELGSAVSVFSPRKASAVRKLIEEELVEIAYQPIWDFDTGRPVGFEALARPHSSLELAGPADAFDIAERIRRVPELDRLCMRKSLESTVDLPKDSVVFVNITPMYLEHFSFDPDELVTIARDAGLRPDQVVIELTERRISDPTSFVKRAKALNDLGIRIALDDTGAGQAGLEILSKLDLAFVKIDRSLLAKALTDKAARGVLAGIIAICRETGSYLIAEGIENEQLLEFARSAGVQSRSPLRGIRGVQGYLLGRPRTGAFDPRQLEECHRYLIGQFAKRAG